MQNLGLDWDERVLPSIGNEVVKAVVAQYNAEQLLTQRDKVSINVSHLLHPWLQTCAKVSAKIANKNNDSTNDNFLYNIFAVGAQ